MSWNFWKTADRRPQTADLPRWRAERLKSERERELEAAGRPRVMLFHAPEGLGRKALGFVVLGRPVRLRGMARRLNGYRVSRALRNAMRKGFGIKFAHPRRNRWAKGMKP